MSTQVATPEEREIDLPVASVRTKRSRSFIVAIAGLVLASFLAGFAVWQTLNLNATTEDLDSTRSTLSDTRTTLDQTEADLTAAEANLTAAEADLDSAKAQVSTCSDAVDLYRTLAFKEGKAIVKVWGYANRWSFVISPLIQSVFMPLDPGDIKEANRAGQACQAGGTSLF